MNSLYTSLIENLKNTTILEYIAVFFGIISPLYSRKENILVYPTGIISVSIYIYLCFQQGIFAEMGINAFYLIMSFYGWYVWTHPEKGKKEKPISTLSNKELIYNVLLTLLFFIILYFILKKVGSTVPVFDSLSTSIFITGMWLMSQKKLENWHAWILGNLISIPLFAYKTLVLTSLYYIIILVIAIFGFISWKKKFDEQK